LINLDPYPEEESLLENRSSFSFKSKEFNVYHVTGFDYIIDFVLWDRNDTIEKFSVEGNTLSFIYQDASGTLSLIKNNNEEVHIDIFPVINSLKDLKSEYYIPGKRMQVSNENSKYLMKVFFKEIQGEFNPSNVEIEYFEAKIFLKIK